MRVFDKFHERSLITADRSHLEPPASLQPSAWTRRALPEKILPQHVYPPHIVESLTVPNTVTCYDLSIDWHRETLLAEILWRIEKGVYQPNPREEMLLKQANSNRALSGFPVPVLVTRALCTTGGTFCDFQHSNGVSVALSLTGGTPC
ncbi:hypothetical protein HC024_11460 [Methylococcaceae bacterium WWC4]|nr:hypothetical protein [Methylococcaceae bacterium WWC4]